MRNWMLIAAVFPLVASECSAPFSGPPKYGKDTITDLRIVPGRLCDDPAGAAIEVHGTYSLECTDEEQCKRDFGKVFSTDFVMDGRAAQAEVTLENGDPSSVPADCSQLTSQLFGEHPEDGPGRDIGGLLPDCSIGLNGPSMGGITDITLTVELMSPPATAELVCPGAPPYGLLQLTTLTVDAAICTNEAAISVRGMGQTECQDASRCTLGEDLTFDYVLGPQPTVPEVTLSNGEKIHLPYSCVDVNLAVWGMQGEERKRVGNLNPDCTLFIDEEQLATVTDLTMEGDYGWLPEVTFTAACE